MAGSVTLTSGAGTVTFTSGAGAVTFSAVGAGAQEKKIVFSTDWGYNGRHAYYFTALDKGYYKAEGLNVEILGGRGSGTVIKEVAAGTVKIGFADAGTLVLARANETTFLPCLFWRRRASATMARYPMSLPT